MMVLRKCACAAATPLPRVRAIPTSRIAISAPASAPSTIKSLRSPRCPMRNSLPETLERPAPSARSLGQFPPAILVITHPRRHGLAGRKLSCPNTDHSLWGQFADASVPITCSRKRSCVDMGRSPCLPPRLGEISKGSFRRYLRCRNCAGFSQSLAIDCDLRPHHGNSARPRSPDSEYTAGGLRAATGTCRKTGSCRLHRRQNPPPRLIHKSEDRPRSRQDNNGSAISWAVEVSIYRFEFIAIPQPPVLNSYPDADLL
jgi:hypothetical protein